MPNTLTSVVCDFDWSKILKYSQYKLLQTIVPEELRLLYIGSDNEFASTKFHQKCDDQGPTLAVCKSELNQVFGFYTSVPWQSEGGNKSVAGEAFLFKIESEDKIVRINQKSEIAHVHHANSQMFSDAAFFVIQDKANTGNNLGGVSENIYDTQGLNIDKNTYLAGSYRFRMKEIEVY